MAIASSNSQARSLPAAFASGHRQVGVAQQLVQAAGPGPPCAIPTLPRAWTGRPFSVEGSADDVEHAVGGLCRQPLARVREQQRELVPAQADDRVVGSGRTRGAASSPGAAACPRRRGPSSR